MEWPYKIISLSVEEKRDRRKLLDRYGLYAQISPFALLATLLLARLVLLLFRRLILANFSYHFISTSSVSPDSKHRTRPFSVSWTTAWRRYIWWLGGEMEIMGLKVDRRDHLVFGIMWSAWLLFLCVKGTKHGTYCARGDLRSVTLRAATQQVPTLMSHRHKLQFLSY